jgi:tetratricopeptide (TPR) repeat protein
MKTFLRITLLFASVLMVATTATMAQRVITGIVYMDGKPAAGIEVLAHKGGSMMTSFDGQYKVEASEKTKWIKFTFIDESKKLDISGQSGDHFDFAFTGEIPSGEATDEGAVNLSLQEQLVAAGDKEYMNQLSLYKEFYKQKDIESAYPHWKNLYKKYPKSTVNVYIHGAKIHQMLIENAENADEKEMYFNDYMNLFDKRIKYYGQKGYILGRKAAAWLEYKIKDQSLEGQEQIDALKTGYNWLNESVDLQKNESELAVIVLLMQTSKSLFKLDALPKETVVINYDKCNSIVKYIIENDKDPEQVKKAKDVQVYIEDIFGKSGAADCDALVNIFTPQFKENAHDVETIKSILRRLRKAGCDGSDLYNEATEKLYELEPSAEAAFNMAHRYLKLEDYDKAKMYYKQAMDQETDQELLANYYYEYALFIYAKENALQEARTYARKALKIKPDYCDAYMLIGDIYVAATRSFEGSDLEKSAVFWVVVDYFTKARKGTDCAIDASKKIATYKKYFPNKEEAFMEGLKTGHSYKVGGWINETTKVRF